MNNEEVAEARRIARAIDEVSEGADETATVDSHPDRVRIFTHLNFSRMRTAWNPEEQEVIDTAMRVAEDELMHHFGEAYIILNKIYGKVRKIKQVNGFDERDRFGFPVWETDENGSYIENYGLLLDRDKEDFLHQLSIRLVGWSQKGVEFWGQAMFAKAMWEERFAHEFVGTPHVEGKRPTEADRTQHAQGLAWDERYYSIYRSMVSKKADALIQSLERVTQRLKDTLR